MSDRELARGLPARPASPGHAEPTWVERLLPLLVIALPLTTSSVGALLDNVVQVVDANYRTVVIYEGSAARDVRVLLLMALLAVAVHLLIAGIRRGRNPITWFVIAGSVAFAAVFLRGGQDPGELVAGVVGLLTIAAAAVSRIDARTLRMVAWIGVAYAASAWLYFLTGAENASRECRPDKCSYLGVLLTGTSSHEQLLGLRLAFLLPALAFLTPRFRVPAVLLMLLTVAASGSRTAMAASLLSLVAFCLLSDPGAARTRPFGIRRGPRALHEVLSFAPLGGLALSLALFLLVSRDAFTSRGEIYSALRGGLLESPLLGPGREELDRAYSVGDLSFLITHEHSQAGYLLTVGGVVFLVLFGAGVIRLTQVALRPGQVAVVLFALAPAAAFVTEPIWTFDATDLGFGTLVLTVMLLATAVERTSPFGRAPGFGRLPEPLHRARQYPSPGMPSGAGAATPVTRRVGPASSGRAGAGPPGSAPGGATGSPAG